MDDRPSFTLEPLPTPRRRTVVQWLGDAPGRFGDWIGRSARQVDAPRVSLDVLAASAAASPRANGYLSLEPGLRVFQTGQGALAWAASKRFAFAVGGVHAGTDGARLLTEFRDRLAEARYRRILLFPVGTDERRMVRAAGFKSLMVGAEAFVNPLDFNLAGKQHADLRQMVNRGRKRYGVVVDEVDAAQSAELLQHQYVRWLAARPAGHRMQLLVGTPCFSRPAGRRYLVARIPERPEPVAFITLTPGWQRQGWGVDVMVRTPDAPAGAMDVLLTEAIFLMRAEGVERFSLGACPMAERTDIPWRDSRVLRWVFRWLYRSRMGNRLFPFASLARYKDKFSPSWEAVHIAAWPRLNIAALYAGCRMWGLFGEPPLVPLVTPPRGGRPGS